MNWRQRISAYAATAFSLDLRSLAVFRMALGLVLLADLWVRSSDFAAMYTDAGIAPVEFVRPFVRTGQWSLHLVNGAAWFQAGLFLLAAMLAAALLIGFHTRLATIGSWALLASLHVRLPVVLNAGDALLRLLLFWGMFLPLGGVWSFDAWRRGAPKRMQFVSIGSAALVVQLALVYWVAGFAKWNDSWLRGDALAQIFSFQYYGLPLGRRLAEFPDMTRWLSHTVLALEILGPCLLFLPWATGRVRTALVVAFVGFHVGILATITVGLFPWAGIAAWLALIPGEFWERTLCRRASAEEGATFSADAAGIRLSRLASIFCAAALALVVYWNVLGLARIRPANALHAGAGRAVNVMALGQSWKVFARPTRFDAYFVYQAHLKNGEMVDLFTGEAIGEDVEADLKPQRLPNHRWRKMHLWVMRRAYAAYRQPLAEYIVRRWNAAHTGGERAVRLDFYCLRRRLEPGSVEGDFVWNRLAIVSLGRDGGAFAEALRELDE